MPIKVVPVLLLFVLAVGFSAKALAEKGESPRRDNCAALHWKTAP